MAFQQTRNEGGGDGGRGGALVEVGVNEIIDIEELVMFPVPRCYLFPPFVFKTTFAISLLAFRSYF